MLSIPVVAINVVLAQFLCLAHWTLAQFLCLAQASNKAGSYHFCCIAGAKKEKLLERLNSWEAEREDHAGQDEKPQAGSPSDQPGTAAQGQATRCPWASPVTLDAISSRDVPKNNQ